MTQFTFKTLDIADSSSDSDRQLFLDEINIMKRASDGNNPHVLKMIGCVTITLPMMVLLQFVPHGNLKDYLLALKMVIQVNRPSPAHVLYSAQSQAIEQAIYIE